MTKPEAIGQQPGEHEQYMPRTDWVSVEKLPKVEQYVAHGDQTIMFDRLLTDHEIVRNFPSDPEVVEKIKPDEVVRNRHNIGIDLELLASDGRSQASDRFRKIIRMGGSFERYRSEMSAREFEAFAVETMGLDASLYFHGVEQARRMEKGMAVQQVLHQRVFDDLYAVFGANRATVSGYNRFSELVPKFNAIDVKKGIICGFGHDYGEVKLGMDVPFELKNDPAYSTHEAGACVDQMTELHFPAGDSQLVMALTRRVESETTDIDFQTPERASARLYLHPKEIADSIFGTEQLHHGPVPRGVFFVKVDERIEYVLSGIRGFEAVEHNFQGIRSDQVLTQNILRLGVSTFFNSLQTTMDQSDQYVYAYDFLRQNTGRIDYYIEAVTADIQARQESNGSAGLFGIDPFVNYSEEAESDVITRDQAKERFLKAAEVWNQWKTKDSLMKKLWETYFGTEHELTKDNPDVSFLHKTSRGITEVIGPEVPVAKGLVDMFGVGLDPEDQAAHEAKAIEAA